MRDERGRNDSPVEWWHGCRPAKVARPTVAASRWRKRDAAASDAGVNLFVHYALDLWNGRAVRRLIVAAVVARLLAVAFHFMIAVVGFPDALALGFVVLAGDGNNRHVVVFVVCQDEPPMRRAAIRVPTRSVSHLKRGRAARHSARRASTFRTRNDKHHTHGFVPRAVSPPGTRPQLIHNPWYAGAFFGRTRTRQSRLPLLGAVPLHGQVPVEHRA